MDRSNVLTLIEKTYTTDNIGQQIESNTERTVYCAVCSVNGNEWFEAGRNGIKADLRVSMLKYEYDGETECALDGVNYGIYRTYYGQGEMVDLYLERKAGV